MKIGYSFRHVWNARTIPHATAQWLIVQRKRLTRKQKPKGGDKNDTATRAF